MFLTADQVRELTGCARVAQQIEWLRARAYAFDLDAKGRPVLLRSYVEARLGGTISSPSGPKLRLKNAAA